MHWGMFWYFYISLFIIFKLTMDILVIFHWLFFIWKGAGAYRYALACWWCSCFLDDACDATGCPNLVFHRVPRGATTSSLSWWSVWQWLMIGLSSVGISFFSFLLLSLSLSLSLWVSTYLSFFFFSIPILMFWTT